MLRFHQFLRQNPNIAIAKAEIKTSGTTMNTELARARAHLAWAKREKASAVRMRLTVKNDYERNEYNDEASRTYDKASADVMWAEQSVEKALNEVRSVSNGALEKIRQAKYKEADDYLKAQKAIHDAEQAVIDADTDSEMENKWFMLLIQSLYRGQS